jgi:hypothetical protein
MQSAILLNKKMDKITYKHKGIMLKETVIFHLQDTSKIKRQSIMLLYKVKEITQMDQQQIVLQSDLPIINKISHQLFKIILLMETKGQISINRLLLRGTMKLLI